MSTPFQRQVELRILQHMHTRLHFGSGPLAIDAIYSWICGGTNISRHRFDDAFESLSKLGYFIESSTNENKQFRMSSFGVDWIEDYYIFSQQDKEKKSLTYQPRFKGTIMIGTRRKKYLDQLAAEETGNKVAIDIESSARWTRSGALAAWIALPIALTAILVTIILDR